MLIRPPCDHPNGVQLGGIGTGRIELARTGRIGLASLTDTWQRPVAGMRGTFAALRWAEGGRFLRLESEHPQGVRAVRYRGRHPVAQCDFLAADVPLRIGLTAFSPLVPHDVAASTVPAAVLAYRVRNLGHQPATVELTLSWEALVGVGGAGAKGEGLIDDRSGVVVAPVRGAHGVGLAFTRPDGGRNSDGSNALLAAAPAGFSVRVHRVWNALDEEADLLAALAAGGCEAVRHDAGDFAAVERRCAERRAKPPSWDDPDPRFGGGRTGLAGRMHPAGALTLIGAIAPDAEAELVFAIGWHAPHHRVAGQTEDHGRAYLDRFADATAAADHLLGGWRPLLAQTTALHAHVDAGDLPPWLADKLINDLTALTANSVLTCAGALATLEATPMMWGSLGTLDQRLIAHVGWSLFQPELNRSELAAFAGLQDARGQFPHFNGNVHQALGSAAVEYGRTDWPDLAMSFIAQVWRDWAETGDAAFALGQKPRVLAAWRFLCEADHDGDGVPEGGSSWDVEHYPGCFIATATLWSATLAVLARLAEHWGDTALAAALPPLQARVSATIERLWGGDYYRKYLTAEGAGAGGDDKNDCFIGQLEGDWLARSLALDPAVPAPRAASAARAIYARNGDAARYRLAPIQVQADGRLPPRKYAWHAWPQYTLAFLDCPALYLGIAARDGALVAAALNNIERFDAVVREDNRTPWATTLWYDARTGLPDFQFAGLDWYMNTPAVWWVLAALSGFTADEPARRIALGPWLPDGRTRARYPVVTPRYWGSVEVAPGGRVRFAIDRFFRGDALELDTIRWRGRIERASAGFQAARCVPAGIYTDIVLPTRTRLVAGDALELAVG